MALFAVVAGGNRYISRTIRDYVGGPRYNSVGSLRSRSDFLTVCFVDRLSSIPFDRFSRRCWPRQGHVAKSRESRYKALSTEGNPEFATVLKVMRALIQFDRCGGARSFWPFSARSARAQA